MAVLHAAVESGVTFLDTADVYGDGRSERIIGRFIAGNAGGGVTVATKMGRRVDQAPENYTLDNFRAWTDRSRVNLGVDTLDLVQLHCPPTAVFSSDAVFDALDTLVSEERIAAYGVSVETSAQALTAIARPGTGCVQIILNAFRRKPLDEVLPAAAQDGVGIIARVPLTTARTTGTARLSTSARRFPGWTSSPAWTPPGNSPPWRCRARPPRRRRCAGSSSSPGFPPSSPAPATPSRPG